MANPSVNRTACKRRSACLQVRSGLRPPPAGYVELFELILTLCPSMKKIVLIALLAVLGWLAYGKYQERQLAIFAAQIETSLPESSPTYPSRVDAASPSHFTCDGRTYCSQMTSCVEATYFLRNCPGVKMDGNNDGIPCEKQWCK